jgi:hypothetical protein
MKVAKSRQDLLLTDFNDVAAQHKLLEQRRNHFPRLFNRFFLALILFASLEFVRSNQWFDWPHIVLISVLTFIFLFRFIVLWNYNRKINRLSGKKQTLSTDLAEAIQGHVEFMSQFEKDTKSFQQKLVQPTYSPLCTLWDYFTRSYRYNRKALICPDCGAHNGLHDPDNPPVYICPHCKSRIGE